MSENDHRLTELAETGEVFRESLRSVFQEVGLDLAALASQGCICCDVGEGPEIPALIKYRPQPFIVSEPTDQHWDREQNDAELESLVQQTKCDLIRDHPWGTLEALAKKNIKVGLITWLIIFPDKIQYNGLLNFLRLAKPLLKPGGAVALSVQVSGPDGEECEGGYHFITAGNEAKKFGYKIDFPDTLDKPFSSAGGVFIIASLPQK